MVLQVLLLALSSIFITAHLGFAKPLNKSFGHIIDEFVVILVLDLLFFTTDPLLDPDNRLMIGYVLIGILGLSIVVNQGTLLIKSLI